MDGSDGDYQPGAWMDYSLTVADLTPREREVALLIGRGLSYRSAADQLSNMNQRRFIKQRGISERTVEAHARAIRDRMGSDLPPARAVMQFYWEHRNELEMVA